MSSPVTLSNFNSIDFNTILNLVMAQASQPLTALQSQQTAIATETSQYNFLATKLGTLETAAASLSTSDEITAYSASVSDPTGIAVSPTTSAVVGTYDVKVSKLAEAQVTAADALTATDAAAVATGGKLTFTVGAVNVDVSVTGSVTLQALADQINATANVPARASVVESAPGAFRLVLTGTSTGLANAFTVTNSLTGGSLTGGVFANVQGADDAAITVNGLSITSSSNTLTSAIPGATLSLLHADSTKTITASIDTDDSTVVASVKTFVSAYNDLITFISNQTQAALKGQTGTLAHESLVREARTALRTALNASYGSGTFKHLAEVGIGFNRTGQLEVTEATLTTALSQDRAGVVALFAGTGTTGAFTNGAFGSVQSALDTFTQTGGLISTAQLQLNALGDRLSDQIADMQDRLAVQRAALQAEYSAADQLMTSLKAAGASLSSTSSSQTSSSLVMNG